MNKKESKYYCTPVYKERITLRDIAEDLSDASTLNVIDIKAAIEGFITRVAKYAAKGYRVYLEDFGSFRVVFKSEGQDDITKVSADDVSGVRVAFRGGSLFKKNLTEQFTLTPGDDVEDLKGGVKQASEQTQEA